MLLACAGLTDLLDGRLARRLKVTSALGAYGDVVADLALVGVAFSALIVRRVYPWWIGALIVLMFVQFVLTSHRGCLIYDPVGKWYGGLVLP